MIEMIINGKIMFQISPDNRSLESLALLINYSKLHCMSCCYRHKSLDYDYTVVVVVTQTMLLTRTCNFSGKVSVFCLQHLWLLFLCLLSFHVEPHSVALFRCLQNLCKVKIWNRTCAYVYTIFDGKKPKSYWSLPNCVQDDCTHIWSFGEQLFVF